MPQPPEPRTISGHGREIETFLAAARLYTGEVQAPAETTRRVLVVLDEVLSNISRHGGGESVGVAVQLEVRGPTLVVTVSDDGPAFDPTAVRSQVRHAPGSRPGGLGLRLIAELTTRVEYQRVGPQNHLALHFAIPAAPTAAKA